MQPSQNIWALPVRFELVESPVEISEAVGVELLENDIFRTFFWIRLSVFGLEVFGVDSRIRKYRLAVSSKKLELWLVSFCVVKITICVNKITMHSVSDGKLTHFTLSKSLLLMSGSCHLDRAPNVKIGVDLLLLSFLTAAEFYNLGHKVL